MDAMSLPLSEPRENTAQVRMSRLAKLPVFWELKGRRAIVLGGTDAAAWKAGLLAACGADVHIYASGLTHAFASLVAKGATGSPVRYTLHKEEWTVTALRGAALIIADCQTDVLAKAVLQAAVSAGVPVNIIDKPVFCQFQFGSIVNRSPVIVAISSDGAAPILTQAIRRRIEAILPTSLRSWAELAQLLRGKVNLRLKSGRARRDFWERFVDRVFTDTPDQADAMSLLASVENCEHGYAKGRVTFVGAGPGDPELLTLKAVRALQAADVIFVRDHVPAAIMELARREARPVRYFQYDDTIRQELATLARQGMNVVRLELGSIPQGKMFADEIAVLTGTGACVKIIPGVSVEEMEYRGSVSQMVQLFRQERSRPVSHAKRVAEPIRTRSELSNER
ncbi:SAM-dependent methyltransferase [Phyllobacterium sp. SB3]|uniref:SAM-dependent methyltransferase n=1 Tax=Phyllobacterium sp. SB3 TaxID=3156073 RepID=UPI0032AF595C